MAPQKARVIPLASVDRIFTNARTLPVDGEAVKELGQMLEEIAMEIVKTAVVVTQYAGRKTVMGSDIIFAFEQWSKKNAKIFDG
nr:NFYB/HAP3 family transcription factor subunit [Candidatus Sigynarchaeota archaeon]